MKMGKSILIVDDEELFGTILRRFFEKEGFIVSYCNKPTDAILLSLKRKFDIIVTDYDMPEMNGADLSRLMRYRFADSYIVGLSCETMGSSFLAAGADAFFEKPIDYRKFVSMISQHNNILPNNAGQHMISV